MKAGRALLGLLLMAGCARRARAEEPALATDAVVGGPR